MGGKVAIALRELYGAKYILLDDIRNFKNLANSERLSRDPATAGDEWLRPALCEDALGLARILAELAPQEREVHGLRERQLLLERARASRA